MKLPWQRGAATAPAETLRPDVFTKDYQPLPPVPGGLGSPELPVSLSPEERRAAQDRWWALLSDSRRDSAPSRPRPGQSEAEWALLVAYERNNDREIVRSRAERRGVDLHAPSGLSEAEHRHIINMLIASPDEPRDRTLRPLIIQMRTAMALNHPRTALEATYRIWVTITGESPDECSATAWHVWKALEATPGWRDVHHELLEQIKADFTMEFD